MKFSQVSVALRPIFNTVQLDSVCVVGQIGKINTAIHLWNGVANVRYRVA